MGTAGGGKSLREEDRGLSSPIGGGPQMKFPPTVPLPLVWAAGMAAAAAAQTTQGTSSQIQPASPQKQAGSNVGQTDQGEKAKPSAHMKSAQMKPGHMKSAHMKPSHMQSAQMQTTR